ncbi:liver carboxylesterase-like [Anopheles darlingi]|uniref:liver carboxylesterase-like n=1 Tax=Anopheles darlingi TaxID=43151 RepID=UPI00210046A7|nr:liver carboxylesterase-like [Anopheles darlingi]
MELGNRWATHTKNCPTCATCCYQPPISECEGATGIKPVTMFRPPAYSGAKCGVKRMLKLVVILSLAAIAAQGQDASRPIINTTGGQIQGVTSSCGLFCSYFAFNGIPYAQPPVGDLRFRNPRPHQGWQGIKDGSEHRETCPSGGFLGGVSGSEDCLYLNVYTQNVIGSRPVMVWIHGGSFTGGSGNSWIYGPDNLMPEDVVVVTINYRLGILGFFSTDDTHAAGNWGMKDCVMALQWVRNNIANFGGDPNNVTIFGESAGGVAVHYLVLSNKASGLFHKAIAQSGTALVPWGFQYRPRELAYQLADKLGYSHDSAQLVQSLRNTPIERLLEVQGGWLDIDIPRGFKPFEFVPNAEPVNSPEETFLTQLPIDILNAGTFNHVPFIAGYMSMESMFMVYEHTIDNTVWDEFTRHPEYFVPHFWNIPTGTAASSAVSQTIRQTYWQDRPLGPDIMQQWMTFHTDQQFIYAIDKTVRLHAQRSQAPTYYYQFSFDGDLNLVKRLLLLGSWPGAMHADDIPYLWSVTDLTISPILPTNHARTVSNRFVRLFTNFARFGNPTPNAVDTLLQSRQWQPVGATVHYMEIGHDLVTGINPNGQRTSVWHDLEARYANDPFRFPRP